jgi:hypothetical protein
LVSIRDRRGTGSRAGFLLDCPITQEKIAIPHRILWDCRFFCRLSRDPAKILKKNPVRKSSKRHFADILSQLILNVFEKICPILFFPLYENDDNNANANRY